MNTNTDFSAIEKKSQRNERIRKIITYVLLTFWAVIVLFPFYWMILTSVKSYSAYNSPDFGEELQRLQLGVCASALHAVSDHAELF